MPIQKKVHPLLPPNANRNEYQILMLGVVNLYQKLEDPTDKFLVAFVFEAGYRQVVAANVLGMTESAVTQRIDRIKKILSVSHNKSDIKSEECAYESASVA